MYEIQKNIALPNEIRRGRSVVYPFDKMEIGDSFLAPLPADATPEQRRKKQVSIVSSAGGYRRRNRASDLKFTTHMEEGGVRVWRIA